MDQVFIQDLELQGVIGIYDWERQAPQKILVNLVLFADLSRAGETDDINDCIDYEALANRVKAFVEGSARQTVEALAADIARLCLSETRAERVRVRVEKPEIYPFARSVGVEIERDRTWLE
jgi:FolB domain-containing protein